ncbi:hypothetical protein GCM10011504_48900 [Siccirubricoccus deserti]|uniref:Uncharacterized protein n=1 Tax=Siccirubricoccus deserti TaxID=2013562 RepID=A0A9X0R2H6_9PROT|nr:hypothetical protein [Siccirubricoccus deserti]MBC4018380.1 hypothetical protein [Siccirubricoccus deserti]GGC65077.1 hypothetical protein GCM10011504_48900 [Siccirubricoccus deserti]
MRLTGRAMVLVGVLLATGATAQERGGAARMPAGRPGMAPLQTEPGDIWAEVRSWTDGARRRPTTSTEPPRQAPRRRPQASPPRR